MSTAISIVGSGLSDLGNEAIGILIDPLVDGDAKFCKPAYDDQFDLRNAIDLELN